MQLFGPSIGPRFGEVVRRLSSEIWRRLPRGRIIAF